MLRRFLLVAWVLIAVSWVGLVPAAAGGPTSALLVAPQTGMTSALYYTQPEYQQLSDAVRGTPTADEGFAEHYRGPGVRITWLIHDVTVWRTDEVYLEADGGPLIATRENDGGATMPDKQVWHRSDNPTKLVQLLGSRHLLDPEAMPDIFAQIPVPSPSAAAADPSASSSATSGSWVALSGWRWIVPGLLLGAGLALAWRWAQRRTGGPRLELIDEKG